VNEAESNVERSRCFRSDSPNFSPYAIALRPGGREAVEFGLGRAGADSRHTESIHRNSLRSLTSQDGAFEAPPDRAGHRRETAARPY